jgi:hypothetical protein
MSLILNGDGAISGLTATGISAVQALPAGSVLQVVQGSFATETQNNTNTYADTGLTATITPKFATSKILVSVNQGGVTKMAGDQNSGCRLKLFRNATDLGQLATSLGYTNTNMYNQIGSFSVEIFDSPATTSALVYKTQFSNTQNTTGARVQESDSVSTITLMEIAQ